MIKLKSLLSELRGTFSPPPGWTPDHQAALDLLNKELGGKKVLTLIKYRRQKTGESLADAVKFLAKQELGLEF